MRGRGGGLLQHYSILIFFVVELSRVLRTLVGIFGSAISNTSTNSWKKPTFWSLVYWIRGSLKIRHWCIQSCNMNVWTRVRQTSFRKWHWYFGSRSLIFSGKGYTNNQLRQNTYTCKHTKSHFQDIILMFIKNYSYLYAWGI